MQEHTDSPIYLSLTEQIDKLKKRKFSVRELITATIGQIEKVDPQLGAFLFINKDEALNLADRLDKNAPDPSAPLWGIPLAIKDALSTKNMPTTAASRILDNFMPIYDAYAVQKLKEAGAIIIGKTNMDEFAMGSTTENSAYKKTRNPWNSHKIPGGSSGGSAVAVSAFECAGALGSDTGGSIRQPAAFCGCVGLKPTYGRVSRYGLFAYASSLDQIGPMARSVSDCALILNVIAGWDKRDNTSASIPTENYFPIEKISLKNIRIGYPKNFFGSHLDEDTGELTHHFLSLLANHSAKLENIDLPDSDLAIATYYIIAMAEASSNLARYDGVRYGRRAPGVTDLQELYNNSRSQGFGTEVKRRIMLGSYILSAGYYDAYFHKAAQNRRLVYEQYRAALSNYDVLILPVSPVVAWNLEENIDDPMQTYLMDAYTVPINLAGLPAISLPVGLGKKSGLPVSIQLVGKPFEEKKLLQIAKELESLMPTMPPVPTLCQQDR